MLMLNLLLNKLGGSKMNQQNQTRYYCIFLNSLIIQLAFFFVNHSKHWSEFHPCFCYYGEGNVYNAFLLQKSELITNHISIILKSY